MTTAKDLMQTEFVKLDVNDPVSKFMGVILKQNETYALLYSENTYKGYADKKSLTRTKIDPEKTKLKNILKNIPQLSPESDLLSMANLFMASDTRVLPVAEKGRIIGIVKESSLVPLVMNDLKNLNASDFVQKRKLITFFDKDPVGLVINKMKEEHVDRAPVTSLRGELVGMITSIDLYAKFHVWDSHVVSRTRKMSGLRKQKGSGFGDKTHSGDVVISNFMTKQCCSCSLNDSLSQAANKMCSEEVTSIVVLEGKTPKGIITITDLLKRYIETKL